MRPILMLACAAALAAAPAAAAPRRAAGLEVTQAWSRPAAAGMTGVGYMTLANRGAAPVTVQAVETAAARRTTLHATTLENGVASMSAMDAGVVVAAGQTVRFAPGGHHVMFMGLKQALKAGDRIPATLVLANGARLKVEFEVRLAPPAP